MRICKLPNIISISFFSWFFAGYDLVLLPLLAKEIGASYFPSINPSYSILAVYATFSMSLLARFFGGYLIGELADNHGRKPIVILCLFSISILMLLSAFLPSVHQVRVEMAYGVVIAFIVMRILVGFFVGGLWPTVAIFSMERLYKYDSNSNKMPQRSVQENQRLCNSASMLAI
jgi:MFS family permease